MALYNQEGKVIHDHEIVSERRAQMREIVLSKAPEFEKSLREKCSESNMVLQVGTSQNGMPAYVINGRDVAILDCNTDLIFLSRTRYA